MPNILTRAAAAAELERASQYDDSDVGAVRAAYNRLTPDDFELLLYALLKADLSEAKYYDDVTLMITGADRGRDVWLTLQERPSGLVQCKRLGSAFTVPETVKEVIKFLLFAELDPGLLPNPKRFCYTLAVSSDPAGTVVNFFAAPKAWLRKNEKQIEGYIRSLTEKYASFANIHIPSVLPRVKDRLRLFEYKLLRPVDLDGRLESFPNVRARFFRVRQVIDIEATRKMLEAQFEVQRQHLATPVIDPLSQALIDEEVRREVEIIRKSRFFEGADTHSRTSVLIKRLQEGDLVPASQEVRAAAIAACVRWRIAKYDPAHAHELIMAASRLGNPEDLLVAKALLAAKTDPNEGLTTLVPINSALRRLAALQIVISDRGHAQAIEWCDSAGIEASVLDSDGRFVLLATRLQASDWDRAYADAVALSDQDFLTTPALLAVAAMARLAQAAPVDLRDIILTGPPFEARGYPLADHEGAIKDRREAVDLLRRGQAAALALGLDAAANSSSHLALWLELRDSCTAERAVDQLLKLLSGGEEAIDYIPLALSFEIKLDRDAVERVLARREALEPKGSPEVALARLSLAIHHLESSKAAEYFAQYRNIILSYIDNQAVITSEINLLLKANQIELARERLSQSEGIIEATQFDRLRVLVAQGAAGDEVSQLESDYERDPSTLHLVRLVAHLKAQGYSDKFFALARKLVVTTRAATDATELLYFLLRNERYDEVALIVEDVTDIMSASLELRNILAWTRYRQGKFNEAAKIVESLRSERDDPNDRALLVNLFIAAGRWPALASVVEEEWAAQGQRSAEELLGIAQLAVRIKSPRLWPLLQAAAARPDADVRIFLGCYMTAVQFGRDDEPEVGRWFQQAVSLSGKDGPVRTASLEELVAMAPDWDRHVEDISEKLRLGAAPLGVAAHLLRRSSLEMQLALMVANKEQADPRRRAVIPAFSGTREIQSLTATSIGLSGSSLVTIAYLGELERLLARPNGIHIPHNTLTWLFEEREKLTFHQPSMIKAARAMSRAISRKRLYQFTDMDAADGKLADLVGRELASMLTFARASDDQTVQRLVVRSAPVHKVGSLRGEEADLSNYRGSLCGCLAVIDKLAERGQLTREEEDYARAYIQRNETRWPGEPIIADGAELYLDDLSVTYLRTANVLEKLHSAGLKAFVSEREVREANALIELESRAETIDETIESLRAALAAGIELSVVAVDSALKADTSQSHPDVAAFQLAGKVDAIVCDDRFLNQHRVVQGAAGSSAIWTTLDLLASIRISDCREEASWRHRTILRQAGYIHVPTSAEEFTGLLARSVTREGSVVETGELRAFRENLLLTQMRGWLALPLEAHWLNKVVADLLTSIRTQWTDDILDSDARARSEWLMKCADLRNWAGQITDGDGIGMARFGLAFNISSLLLSPHRVPSTDAAARFETWLEERIINQLKDEDPQIYEWFLRNLRSIIVAQVSVDV